MKKKKKLLLIAGIGLVLLGIAGVVGYNILFPNDPLVQEEHDTSHLEQEEVIETSTPGYKIVSIAPLDGSFSAVMDSSELFFYNGVRKGTSGKFKSFTANVTGDGTPDGMSVSVEVDANSLYTYNDIRDGHLKGEEFFNTAKYPEMSFKSSSVALIDTGYVANGTMMFMGVEKPVEIPFKYHGKSTYPDGREYHVLEGDFLFNPGDHGMQTGSTVSDRVTVSFYLELVKD